MQWAKMLPFSWRHVQKLKIGVNFWSGTDDNTFPWPVMYLLSLLADKAPAKPQVRYKQTISVKFATILHLPFELYRFLKHLYSRCLLFLKILCTSCSLCLPVHWSETWKELKKRTIAPVSFFSVVYSLFKYLLLFSFSEVLLFWALK